MVHISDEVELDEERENRYLDKLDTLEDRLGDIDAWMESPEQLLENRQTQLAVFKTFQEAAEIVADLCAMYLSDTGRGIGDDRSNIEKSAGTLYSDELEGDLGEVNGLRNRIVHDYEDFDEEEAVHSLDGLVPAIDEFEQEVREWILSS